MATATHYRHLFTPSISTKRKHQRQQVLPLLVSTTRSSTPTTSATILTISARLEMTFTRLEMTFTRLEMTFTRLEMTFTKHEMTFGTKKNIRNAR